MAKGEYMMGFLGGMNFTARLNEVALMSMLQKYLEGGEWKKNYNSLEELFGARELPFSYQTYRRRIEDLKQIGPEIQGMLKSRLKSNWGEVRMIERLLTNEQKEALKKEKAIQIGEQKIVFCEENYDTIMANFHTLRTSVANAEKAHARSEKTLAEIEKEHEKEIESLVKVKGTQAAKETPEWVLAAWKNIQEHVNEFDDLLREFALGSKTQELIARDVILSGKIEGIQQEMMKKLSQTWREWVIAHDED